MPRRIGPVAAVLALVATIALLAFAAPAPPAVGQESESLFLGSNKCGMCHRDRHESWKEDEHSRAFESLKPADLDGRKDMNGKLCVSCHVTGFGEPGGFVSAEKTPKMKNVGCESCHGPGRRHAELILKSVLNDTADADEIAKQARAAIDGPGHCSPCHDPHVSYEKLYGDEDEGDDDK